MLEFLCAQRAHVVPNIVAGYDDGPRVNCRIVLQQERGFRTADDRNSVVPHIASLAQHGPERGFSSEHAHDAARGETQLFEKKTIGAVAINLTLMHFDGLYARSNAAMVDA